MQAIESGTPINLTATGQVGVVNIPTTLLGFYVNSTSSGVIAFRDGGSGGTAVSGSITPAIGFHRFPGNFPNGCHMTLVSGSINITLFIVAAN